MAQNSNEDADDDSVEDSEKESDTDASKQKSESDEKLLSEIREYFKLVADAEKDQREDALDDLNFRAGKQWPDKIMNEREQDSRPCLVINKLPQFIKQITNEQRQNRPSIKVDPVDDKSDPDTADIYQGLIRHIEYDSNADFAYDTSFEGAVTSGFGYHRVITDYVDPMSFDQEILIKRIRNPFTVYFDPNASEPDGSDSNRCLIVDDLTPEVFKKLYPNAKPISLEELKSVGDDEADWLPSGKVRIAEYFYKVFRSAKINLYNNNAVYEDGKEPKALPEGVVKINSRTANIPTIKWCKVSGLEILEEREWPGIWIPVIPVYGDELDVNGKIIREGIVRHSKDSQRLYNFFKSAETETIALAPKAPYIGVVGQFEGVETQWGEANRRNVPYLEYNDKGINGAPIGPPQRQVFEAPVQAITQAGREASDDIKATTGIYDAALGNKSNESSGVAIQRRNAQTQTSNYHYIDNLSRSIRHTGRILVDLIPKIYDTPRVIRIVGEDDQQKIVKINQMFKGDDGKDKSHMLSAGKYDVVCDTGPSYATRRQEATASMLDLAKTAPQLMQNAGDLLVGSMDWPMAKEIAERIRKTLPPGIADDPNNKNPMPPEAMNAINQFKNQNQQLIQHLNEKTQIIEQKQIETDQKKMELESKERIAIMQTQAEIEIALAKMGSESSQTLLEAEIAELHNKLKLLGSLAPNATDLNPAQPDPNDPNNSGEGGSPGALPSPQSPTGGTSPANPMEQS